MNGLQAVVDSAFALRAYPARFLSRTGKEPRELAVVLEHGGRDKDGGEMVLRIRRSELPDEPEIGSVFECAGRTFHVRGVFPAPQTTSFVWAVSCSDNMRTSWR